MRLNKTLNGNSQGQASRLCTLLYACKSRERCGGEGGGGNHIKGLLLAVAVTSPHSWADEVTKCEPTSQRDKVK
jgi:hypothetical protein